jgi:hypothetical protein
MLHIPSSRLEHSLSNSKLSQDHEEKGVQADNIISEPHLRWCCRTCLLHQDQPRLCRKHLQRRSCYLEAFHLHPDELHHLVRCSPGIGVRPCGWNYPVCCWLVSWINPNLCTQDLSVFGCSLQHGIFFANAWLTVTLGVLLHRAAHPSPPTSSRSTSLLCLALPARLLTAHQLLPLRCSALVCLKAARTHARVTLVALSSTRRLRSFLVPSLGVMAALYPTHLVSTPTLARLRSVALWLPTCKVFNTR